FSGHVVPLTFSDHHVYYSLFFFMCAPLRSTLFPYTTLFRSCADIGVTRIECGEGFTEMTLKAADVVKMASERGLDVQFELGKKHTGAFTEDGVTQLIEQGRRWLDAGALQLVVEARESAKEVGLFDDKGNLRCGYADRFAKA